MVVKVSPTECDAVTKRIFCMEREDVQSWDASRFDFAFRVNASLTPLGATLVKRHHT